MYTARGRLLPFLLVIFMECRGKDSSYNVHYSLLKGEIYDLFIQVHSSDNVL